MSSAGRALPAAAPSIVRGFRSARMKREPGCPGTSRVAISYSGSSERVTSRVSNHGAKSKPLYIMRSTPAV